MQLLSCWAILLLLMKSKVTGARAAALYVLSRCRRFDAWSPQVLAKAVELYHLDERDSALCSRLCLGVLQNSALMDYYIGCYSSTPASRMEPQVLDILRIGVCQLLFMDRIPVNAAVNESVELAKKTNAKAAGLVNAVLRRVAENRGNLPAIPGEGTAEELSVRYSHPIWMCEKIVAEHGYEFAKAFFEANNQEPVVTVSVNACKISRDDYYDLLVQAGYSAVKSENAPYSIHIPDAGNITKLPGFHDGLFFVQDEAAAMAVGFAMPSVGMKVLDGCSAPGGKSMLSAVYMMNQGSITSCDLHEKKLSRIHENASRLGIDIIQTQAMDGSKPKEEFRDAFDLVIADVPCSGLGVIRKKPEIRYKPQSDVERLPEVQLRILRGLASCVKPGGKLLYSTCTILREENENVVDAFLKEGHDFAVEDMQTLWPHKNGTDGFFICRMKRND